MLLLEMLESGFESKAEEFSCVEKDQPGPGQETAGSSPDPEGQTC